MWNDFWIRKSLSPIATEPATEEREVVRRITGFREPLAHLAIHDKTMPEGTLVWDAAKGENSKVVLIYEGKDCTCDYSRPCLFALSSVKSAATVFGLTSRDISLRCNGIITIPIASDRFGGGERQLFAAFEGENRFEGVTWTVDEAVEHLNSDKGFATPVSMRGTSKRFWFTDNIGERNSNAIMARKPGDPQPLAAWTSNNAASRFLRPDNNTPNFIADIKKTEGLPFVLKNYHGCPYSGIEFYIPSPRDIEMHSDLLYVLTSSLQAILKRHFPVLELLHDPVAMIPILLLLLRRNSTQFQTYLLTECVPSLFVLTGHTFVPLLLLLVYLGYSLAERIVQGGQQRLHRLLEDFLRLIIA